ncbi:hypothetical protein AMECASPLE_039362 [Ameca splendens]|uniref:Uncharacterized protein n=1 Tax=Ameca splendens TaxID=208324 RepID=A0ABV0ZTB8_9TELE
MSNVAKALEKIQQVNQAYLGRFLLIVVAIIMKMKETKFKHLLYCSPLVDGILTGITKRFGLFLEDQECLLAAAFHPKFRLLWLEQFNNMETATEITIQTALTESNVESSSIPSN